MRKQPSPTLINTCCMSSDHCAICKSPPVFRCPYFVMFQANCVHVRTSLLSIAPSEINLCCTTPCQSKNASNIIFPFQQSCKNDVALSKQQQLCHGQLLFTPTMWRLYSSSVTCDNISEEAWIIICCVD
jgi:hypothetical protein